ncbi:hypothetical protein FJT64_014712 [Amphibalanus amphitrite]|uniref:Uncharacterized protein n=1 Tax=Amphibalanus amphitrite TaxID=1232801 RepID=A0A6A4UVQ5_AMPAM|nr:hypothetical protein FJT64_014712 [Amphibalanus amphitrite]
MATLWIVAVFVMVCMKAVTVSAAAETAGEENTGTQSVSLTCQQCTCGQQESVFSFHCELTGTEDVVLNSSGPLDFSSRTLYMRVEGARSLHMGEGFLSALRRYYSVAVDLWGIGNVTFAAEFRPKNRFLFMGVGIVNSTVPELPRGVLSHSNAVGLRVSGSQLGAIRRGAFAQVNKVRYIELSSSQVATVEGPQMGRLELSHRRHVHHGSSGLRVHGCRLGAVQEGALSLDTQMEDEFVEISDTVISELGPGGLSATGVGSTTINHTVFGYLSTGALDLSTRGGISLLHSRVLAAAPAPLWRVRGGNGTQLKNITFEQPPSAAMVVLDQPTGAERLSQLRFPCPGGAPLGAGWTAAAVAGRQTVPEGLRRYLQLAEEAAECHPEPEKEEEGPQSAAAAQPPPEAAGGTGMFTNARQVGLEILILTLAAAVVTAIVKVVMIVRERRLSGRMDVSDAQILVEASDAPGP